MTKETIAQARKMSAMLAKKNAVGLVTQVSKENDEPDWDKLCNEATTLCVRLRYAQTQCPKGSVQRIATGQIAHALDCWCRFLENNAENWSQ